MILDKDREILKIVHSRLAGQQPLESMRVVGQ